MNTRALCHVSLAILNKLNHFNAHVRQLLVNLEGGKKAHSASVVPEHGQVQVFRGPDNDPQPDPRRPRHSSFHKRISKNVGAIPGQ